MNAFKAILEVHDEGVLLCEALCDSLRKERHAMVHFQLEEMLQNNFEKESALRKLKQNRHALGELVQETFELASTDEIELHLDSSEQDLWKNSRSRWLRQWETLVKLTRDNQRFLQHSHRNLGFITDNLKRVFKEFSTYSARGKRVESATEGKMIGRKY